MKKNIYLASALVIALLSQDIVWAYPDILSRRDSVQARTLFTDPSRNVDLIAQYITRFIGAMKAEKAVSVPSVEAIFMGLQPLMRGTGYSVDIESNDLRTAVAIGIFDGTSLKAVVRFYNGSLIESLPPITGMRLVSGETINAYISQETWVPDNASAVKATGLSRRDFLKLCISGAVIAGVSAVSAAIPGCIKSPSDRKSDVTIYVLDDFSGTDSHGKKVENIIRDSAFNCGNIKTKDLGAGLSAALYRETLLSILKYKTDHPEERVLVNISFGGRRLDLGEIILVMELIDNGVAIIAAAGNDNSEKPFFPSALPGVIAVAACNDTEKTAYSNYGEHISIAAPGYLSTEEIKVKKQNQTYIMWHIKSGTSFSAPRVTGMAAYLLHQNPGMPAKDVIEAIKNTASPLNGSQEFRDKKMGAGRMNDGKVLWLLDPYYRVMYYAAFFAYLMTHAVSLLRFDQPEGCLLCIVWTIVMAVCTFAVYPILGQNAFITLAVLYGIVSLGTYLYKKFNLDLPRPPTKSDRERWEIERYRKFDLYSIARMFRDAVEMDVMLTREFILSRLVYGHYDNRDINAIMNRYFFLSPENDIMAGPGGDSDKFGTQISEEEYAVIAKFIIFLVTNKFLDSKEAINFVLEKNHMPREFIDSLMEEVFMDLPEKCRDARNLYPVSDALAKLIIKIQTGHAPPEIKPAANKKVQVVGKKFYNMVPFLTHALMVWASSDYPVLPGTSERAEGTETRHVLAIDIGNKDNGKMAEIIEKSVLGPLRKITNGNSELSILLGNITIVAGTGTKLEERLQSMLKAKNKKAALKKENIVIVTPAYDYPVFKKFEGVSYITAYDDSKLSMDNTESMDYLPITELILFSIVRTFRGGFTPNDPELKAFCRELAFVYGQINGAETVDDMIKAFFDTSCMPSRTVRIKLKPIRKYSVQDLEDIYSHIGEFLRNA